MHSARRHALACVLAAAFAASTAPAFAQAAAPAWPTKPVRLIVPFAPGGSSEIVARSLAAELSKTLGQQVYVENKPGAGGNVAMEEAARSTDGHTLILGHIGTLAVNPYIYPKLPYDPNKDFAPITLLAKVPSLYLVPASSPVKDMKGFIEYARKNPGKLNYGSAGNGSAGHLAMEYLKAAGNLYIVHVPYRGTGPQLNDLLAGRLDAAAVGAPAVMGHVKAGTLRAIATGTTTRLPQLPDVPTVAESGMPGFEMTQWYGLLAPASMPKANQDKLAAATQAAVKSEAMKGRLAADAALAAGGTPADFAAFIVAEQKRWQPVIQRAQVKPD
jgi:tripartite-type tricarboxylate transporter receptor subunit TctC